MNTKTLVFAIFFASILGMGCLHEIYGADLHIEFDPNNDSSEFKIAYYPGILLRYPDGGQIADELRGSAWRIEATASTPDPDAAALRDILNQKIFSDGSGAQISDLTVMYTADMSGRSEYASVDYKIILNGNLTNYNIAADTGADGKKLVDMGWRGMSVFEPVYIGDVEINLPISALAAKEQAIYSYMRDLDVAKLLQKPIMNAEGIKNYPLQMFNTSRINMDMFRDGLSIFVMDENSAMVRPQLETYYVEEFVIDEKYILNEFKFVDTGTIAVIGFALADHLGDLEVLYVTQTAFAEQTETEDIPAIIIYGLAGIAATGCMFFVFGRRYLKKDAIKFPKPDN